MFQHHHAEYISSTDIHIYGQWISTNRKHQHDVGQFLQVFDVCFSVKPDTSTKLIICANTVRLGRYALSQICHKFEHHITEETFRNSWQKCMLVINLFPNSGKNTRTQQNILDSSRVYELCDTSLMSYNLFPVDNFNHWW